MEFKSGKKKKRSDFIVLEQRKKDPKRGIEKSLNLTQGSMDETDENNKIEKSETNEEEKLMTLFIGYFSIFYCF
jgi:hypothetical protein